MMFIFLSDKSTSRLSLDSKLCSFFFQTSPPVAYLWTPNSSCPLSKRNKTWNSFARNWHSTFVSLTNRACPWRLKISSQPANQPRWAWLRNSHRLPWQRVCRSEAARTEEPLSPRAWARLKRRRNPTRNWRETPAILSRDSRSTTFGNRARRRQRSEVDCRWRRNRFDRVLWIIERGRIIWERPLIDSRWILCHRGTNAAQVSCWIIWVHYTSTSVSPFNGRLCETKLDFYW